MGCAGWACGADGFSTPYLLAMAMGSAVYGYLGLLLFFCAGKKICARPLGISSHAGDLVGEFPAGVHVLQSVVVACALGVFGSSVSLVLGKTRRTCDLSNGSVGVGGWFDD